MKMVQGHWQPKAGPERILASFHLFWRSLSLRLWYSCWADSGVQKQSMNTGHTHTHTHTTQV